MSVCILLNVGSLLSWKQSPFSLKFPTQKNAPLLILNRNHIVGSCKIVIGKDHQYRTSIEYGCVDFVYKKFVRVLKGTQVADISDLHVTFRSWILYIGWWIKSISVQTEDGLLYKTFTNSGRRNSNTIDPLVSIYDVVSINKVVIGIVLFIEVWTWWLSPFWSIKSSEQRTVVLIQYFVYVVYTFKMSNLVISLFFIS